MEVWTLTHSHPEHLAKAAPRAEEAGWTGLVVVDSQNLSPDSYVGLTVAARETKRLLLGTGVTNGVTRHAAVAASAASAVQIVSAGRMVLGIGRGDSALAHLGRSPSRLGAFEHYLDLLSSYLRGDRVPFDAIAIEDSIAAPVEDLGLADHPSDSRLHWLGKGHPTVPIEVAATGPRVIELGARFGDRVMLTLGCDSERLAWGIAQARRLRSDLRVGAYVNLICHPDKKSARALVRGGLTTFARFSVMHGSIAGPASASDRKTLEQLRRGYDMKQHTRSDSAQAGLMSDDFIDRFSIAGTPEYCLERLAALASLGIDKVIVTGPTAGGEPAEARRAIALFEGEVLREALAL